MEQGLRMYHDGSDTAATLKAWDLCRSFGVGDMRTEVLRDISIDLQPNQLSARWVDDTRNTPNDLASNYRYQNE